MLQYPILQVVLSPFRRSQQKPLALVIAAIPERAPANAACIPSIQSRRHETPIPKFSYSKRAILTMRDGKTHLNDSQWFTNIPDRSVSLAGHEQARVSR
jgi:hypothetical protein